MPSNILPRIANVPLNGFLLSPSSGFFFGFLTGKPIFRTLAFVGLALAFVGLALASVGLALAYVGLVIFSSLFYLLVF